MSFLSGLMKIGGAVAAPFTGGASLGLTGLGGALDKVGKAGAVAGGQQSGANNARIAQGQLDLSRDRNVLDLYNSQQTAQNQAGQLDLQRKGFESSNRGTTAKQALIAALLGGGSLQPTSIAGGVRSGGLLEALKHPEAMAAMKTLGGQASEAQSTPLSFMGGQMIAPPTLSAPQKIDIGNKGIGNILTKIAQIAGAFGTSGGE